MTEPHADPCPFCGEVLTLRVDVFTGAKFWCHNHTNVERCPIAALRLDPDQLTLWNHRAGAPETYQNRVYDWLVAAFGNDVAFDNGERLDRFAEEAFELMQAAEMPIDRVTTLLDYVYNKRPGNIETELGDVMVTLAGLSNSLGHTLEAMAEMRLRHCWDNTGPIRAKQASKPAGSPLPVPTPTEAESPPVVSPDGSVAAPVADAFDRLADAFRELSKVAGLASVKVVPGDLESRYDDMSHDVTVLRQMLQNGVDLIDGDLTGGAWKAACHTFTANARKLIDATDPGVHR